MSKYVSRKIVELFTAANIFNEEYNAILKIIMNMNHNKNWATIETFAQRKD